MLGTVSALPVTSNGSDQIFADRHPGLSGESRLVGPGGTKAGSDDRQTSSVIVEAVDLRRRAGRTKPDTVLDSAEDAQPLPSSASCLAFRALRRWPATAANRRLVGRSTATTYFDQIDACLRQGAGFPSISKAFRTAERSTPSGRSRYERRGAASSLCPQRHRGSSLNRRRPVTARR